MMKTILAAPVIILAAFALAGRAAATEYHVATTGHDSNTGSKATPFKTISAAARIAQPGDTITVHEGTYRERINPPRGGAADDNRIIYQAAKGEQVIVKGSEVVKGWKHEQNDTWKVTLPNTFFGEFNPFTDLISGDWYRNHKNAKNHTGAVYLNGNWLTETFAHADVIKPAGQTSLWFAQAENESVTIWAQFKGVDPNKELVEINVRQSVFYPANTGMNYITVRGFIMEHAATPWAPPTAEQIGLIGTNWSMGWIIENNTIRHSACTGITLGKHGDEFDNTSQNRAVGYVETIERALKRGWSKQNIGHHLVRNNHISHCGQAGIVGSMGAAFSKVTGNVIHDIHLGRSFGGAEMAGIKFHGAIDTVISNNHVYRCGGHGGIWLDWMTQGTRVTRNFLHDNSQDLFVEVNHGPFLIDHNVFLSPGGILEASGGGAYVHNLLAGQVRLRAENSRDTPFHPPHSTKVAGLSKVVGDDERFYNNLIVGHTGLAVYDAWKPAHLQAVGNVYLAGAKPSAGDRDALVDADFDPALKLEEKSDGWWLQMTVDPAWITKHKRAVVTTELLGKAIIPDLPYKTFDGKPYRLDTDYFGEQKDVENPAPGPFEDLGKGNLRLEVWQVDH